MKKINHSELKKIMTEMVKDNIIFERFGLEFELIKYIPETQKIAVGEQIASRCITSSGTVNYEYKDLFTQYWIVRSYVQNINYPVTEAEDGTKMDDSSKIIDFIIHSHLADTIAELIPEEIQRFKTVIENVVDVEQQEYFSSIEGLKNDSEINRDMAIVKAVDELSSFLNGLSDVFSKPMEDEKFKTEVIQSVTSMIKGNKETQTAGE